MAWDIVLNIEELVYDYGTITRVDYNGEKDLIKIVRPDGYTLYIGTPDRYFWTIYNNIDNIPEDFQSLEYYYIDNQWIKTEPPTNNFI